MTTTVPEPTARRPTPDPAGRSFIEVQFPVSKLSKESYNERKAAAGQTLTGLGKWWGRKPLVLVRGIILGLLLPATDDPEADRDVFLALMTMDDDGFLRRLDGAIPAKDVYELTPTTERAAGFVIDAGKPKWRPGSSAAERRRLQLRAFRAMSYDQRLKFSKRPEEIDGPGGDAWTRINAHLGTDAASLPELVRELGERRFGHTPRVGDAFCGGGSIPFEAARIGCDACASDLNPVAGLLTWGALNIVGGGEEAVARVRAAQAPRVRGRPRPGRGVGDRAQRGRLGRRRLPLLQRGARPGNGLARAARAIVGDSAKDQGHCAPHSRPRSKMLRY